MMCYRDRTFCRYYKICKKGDKCTRALTEEVKEQASYLGQAVSQYLEVPDCFSQIYHG